MQIRACLGLGRTEGMGLASVGKGNHLQVKVERRSEHGMRVMVQDASEERHALNLRLDLGEWGMPTFMDLGILGAPMAISRRDHNPHWRYEGIESNSRAV